ncbi:thioredoxin-like protein [Earliella scabrosa]|nr:thioredoxin-like protein [Earliella scabrosa]
MAEAKNITLYAAVDSPFPHRIRLALEEAGVEYNTIWIDLIGDKPEWYEKKVYPAAKVPYLIYGGKTLQPDEAPSPDAVKVPESLVILEFLADVFPNSGLLPADPALRARARLFYQAVDSKFLPAFFAFFFLKAPLDALLGALQGMQSLLPEEGFAVGEWSIADATFTPLLMRLNLFLTVSPFTLKEEVIKQAVEALRSPRFARLQKYLEDNMARPSMAKTWDEDAVRTVLNQRLDRFKRTGKINSDLTVPVPAQE